MKVNVDRIVVELTPYEARIISGVLREISGNDPFGDAAKRMDIPIHELIKVCRELEDELRKKS